MTKEKICCRCKKTLPLTSFYKCDGRKDGLQTKCKDCGREAFKSWRHTDDGRTKQKAWRKRYYASDEGRAKNAAAQRKWRRTPSGRLTVKANNMMRPFDRPEEHEAYRQFKSAKKRGLIVPGPCEVCGDTNRIHGHHDDYSKPLEVRWLCPKHHTEHHRRMDERNQHIIGAAGLDGHGLVPPESQQA